MLWDFLFIKKYSKPFNTSLAKNMLMRIHNRIINNAITYGINIKFVSQKLVKIFIYVKYENINEFVSFFMLK